jgi:uncharacterized protein YndB with AHSA1/START domain
MKTVKQEYTIKAPINKVWQALVDTKIINEWGGGPSVMDDQEGTLFKLWGGDIYGKNISVVPPKLLIQEWYDDNFEEPSEARFELNESGDITVVRLIHSNVPDDRVDDISGGWKVYYLGPLKELLDS